eukprot:scaffold381_cov178-Amphora_coffeaeformis.AAC.15
MVHLLSSIKTKHWSANGKRKRQQNYKILASTIAFRKLSLKTSSENRWEDATAAVRIMVASATGMVKAWYRASAYSSSVVAKNPVRCGWIDNPNGVSPRGALPQETYMVIGPRGIDHDRSGTTSHQAVQNGKRRVVHEFDGGLEATSGNSRRMIIGRPSSFPYQLQHAATVQPKYSDAGKNVKAHPVVSQNTWGNSDDAADCCNPCHAKRMAPMDSAINENRGAGSNKCR